jgi:Flp pilus assembly CpaE family ATPase
MLRGIVICPDVELGERFQQLVSEIGHVHITRTMDRYPSALELLRFLRAHAPHVVFLGIDSMQKAVETVQEIEKHTPGVQIFALGRQCDAGVLLDVMRAGIREFASLPFDRVSIKEALIRISHVLENKPPMIESTDNVFAFLPSKAGVGASTLAVNASVALSRLPNNRVLLSDFDLNSGMIRFMLKLDNNYGVIDAAEHALHMDESLWPPMVTTIDSLDVLHAGRLNPDFRIEPAQIRHMIDFMRRNYKALCFDLSGNLEKYSLEIMHEAKKIFLVCTPEIPSLHLAREKYLYLRQLDLQDRVFVLLNRCQKNNIISPAQIEQLLGLPIQMTFPNDYQGVHRALTLGKWVEPSTELGRQFGVLAQHMVEARPKPVAAAGKKRFLEYFSVVPGRFAIPETKKPAV